MDLTQFKTWGSARFTDALLPWVESKRWWLWGFVVICYLSAFNGQWRPQPDAALYLSIGRNIAEGRGYTYLGRPNAVAYPGWPVFIAGAFKVFGSDSLLPVNILITLIALLTVALVYRLVWIHSGRPTAVIVAVGTALTKAFFVYGFELWSDMPFAMGVMAFLAGYEGAVQRPNRPVERLSLPARKCLDWGLLICGLMTAIAMRPTGWPLLVAVAITLVVDAIGRRIRWVTLAGLSTGFLAIAATFVSLSYRSSHGFGDVYTHFVVDRLTGESSTSVLPALLANARSLFEWAASDILFQVRLGPYFNAIIGAIVLLLGFSLFRYRLLWGLWFCFLLATILAAQETLDRYFLPVLPLLVFAWWKAIVRTNRVGSLPMANLVCVYLLGFGMILNFTKDCGIIFQQRTRPFLTFYDRGTFEAVPEFARQLQKHTQPDAIVFACAPYSRVTAFLSRRYVTNPLEYSFARAGSEKRPIYLIEPLDESTKPKMQSLLKEYGLVEGPALFTTKPSRTLQSFQPALSLHATYRMPMH
jgi:4-amino-4-deoxy-L-arabinose transferase-like glycosyltransferase